MRAVDGSVGSAVVQRACSCEHASSDAGRDDREGILRRSASGREALPSTAPPIVHVVLAGSGRPLPPTVEGEMAGRLHHDFSGVRVHTGDRAEASARSVSARAYTVGQQVVFGANQFRPEASDGRSLIAHELVHTMQQRDVRPAAGGSIPIGAVDHAHEREAESISTGANDAGMTRSSPTSSVMLSRQPAAGAPNGCTADQLSQIDAARRVAAIRCQIARFETIGTVTPGPPRARVEDAARRRARQIATQLFGGPMNMDQVGDIVGNMGRRLSRQDLPIVCARSSDTNCGDRNGYVVGNRPPIHLCDNFFGSDNRASPDRASGEGLSHEERVRTMVHEAAHLEGIGESGGESYCDVFDCESSCGGFNVADSWSHYVHCVTSQTPDVPETIEASP